MLINIFWTHCGRPFCFELMPYIRVWWRTSKLPGNKLWNKTYAFGFGGLPPSTSHSLFKSLNNNTNKCLNIYIQKMLLSAIMPPHRPWTHWIFAALWQWQYIFSSLGWFNDYKRRQSARAGGITGSEQNTATTIFKISQPANSFDF